MTNKDIKESKKPRTSNKKEATNGDRITKDEQKEIDARNRELQMERDIAQMGESAASLITRAERLPPHLTTIPLTNEGARNLAREYPKEFEHMNELQAERIAALGLVYEKIQSLQHDDPHKNNKEAWRSAYKELAQRESNLPLLTVYNYVNTGVIAKMPLPLVELRTMDEAEKIEHFLDSTLGTNIANRLGNNNYYKNKLNEVIRGIAAGLSEDFIDLKALVALINQKPNEVTRAIVDTLHISPFDSIYENAVDSAEQVIVRTVDTEGDSLAYDVGYALSKTLALMIPGTSAIQAAKMTAMSAKTISKLPQIGDLNNRMSLQKNYGRMIESVIAKFPKMSVLSARALVQSTIEAANHLTKKEQASLINGLVEDITTRDYFHLFTNKPLLKFVVHCVYTTDNAYKGDILRTLIDQYVIDMDKVEAIPDIAKYLKDGSELPIESVYTILGISEKDS